MAPALGDDQGWTLLAGGWETWSGADVTARSAFAYGGIVHAPFGSTTSDGLRLRVDTAEGMYRYEARFSAVGLGRQDVIVTGRARSAAALVGWQQRWMGSILKAYLGPSYADHWQTPDDPGNAVRGSRFGVKTAIETWSELGAAYWLSGSLTYDTAFADYRAALQIGTQLETGWWPVPHLKIGIEAAALGNTGYDAVRVGAFTGFATPAGDLTLMLGASGDYDVRIGSYAGVTLYSRF